MKFLEIKSKSRDELTALLREQQQHREQLRFQIAQDTNKNVRELRAVKKVIAKIMTALHGQAVPSTPAAGTPAPAKVATPEKPAAPSSAKK
ncbi:MAG: 50S ribosomal protein L29 [Patescibacteria group bacterium]|nr:50S ribosomal protein L29 [Patescibacteria group bacterium]